MVLSIARQSVIQKCNLQKSILIGNYEFYYLAGLLHKLYGIDVNENMKPGELFEAISQNLGAMKPEDEKQQYLIKLVSVYEPLENYDRQMQLLFIWGANEQDLWSMQTSYKPEET